MSKELEVKILDINVDEMIKRLEKIGAVRITREKQTNYTFKSNKDIISNGSYLRIRKTIDEKGVKKELTFKKKGNSQILRSYEEYTTNITDIDMTIEILKNLSLEIEYVGYKDRISYKLDDVRFDIDIWDKKTYPYPYMEIEVQTEQDLLNVVKKLNIKQSQITKDSITQLREKKSLLEK